MDTYKIDHVARMTGLSKHVIRSWERRFDLIKPVRGGNRYRMYSQEDVELLIYLKDQLEEGFAIGELASLGRDELIARIQRTDDNEGKEAGNSLDRILESLLSSISPLDRNKFVRLFNEYSALLPFDEVFYKIFIPLQRKIGDLWHEGKIGVGEEHFVSNHIRQKFLSVLNQIPSSSQGPKVVIACLPDEQHELAIWIAAYQCARNGCQVFYLGASMPVKELAAFCTLTRPNLVLLSWTTSLTEPEAKSLVEDYVQMVLPICPIWAGGAGAYMMREYFKESGIEVLESLHVLEDRLKRLSQFLPNK
ncbi:MAG: cobalamin B12-binding domain-containing protein [Candidatus Nitronauta litoralis]|uniref:Cobalamin B12-binding domain-containing protein n=1 Tax=Candidatus Nitronauta litoralis TaxID=2705533 RepID=A0A7T0BWX2_9BACT|nr:MAG: cobalamin B12-binding domain-containing protein [Candidatus Nitronauta litoralis]